MTSSGTNLAILGGGSPKEEQKMQLNKMYSGNGGIFGGLNTNKKTLQSTNSTSNLDTYNSGAGMLSKGSYFPTLR